MLYQNLSSILKAVRSTSVYVAFFEACKAFDEISHWQGWGQVQYLYLSTYLSVLDVLEYLVYGNAKVLVLDQKVLGTYNFQVLFLKKCKKS